MTTELLPSADDAGSVRRWFLPVNDSGARVDLEYYRPYARFLGLGSSHTVQHSDQPHPGGFVPRRLRCNACRWFEARIFRELLLPDGVESLDELDDPADARLGSYVVHNAGMSIVSNEVPLYRFETTPSPDMVVELLTTRRTTDGVPRVFLAKPAASALASAALYDQELRDAYLNRAVS